MKKQKKQKNTFSSKRILPVEPKKETKPVVTALNPKTVLAEFKNYGDPFNLVKTEKTDAPAILNFKCMAAWVVQHGDQELLDFMALEDELGNVKTLYHGTPTRNIASIAKQGLVPGGNYAMFGSGVYAGSAQKAWGYSVRGNSRNYGNLGATYLLKVRIILGKVKECQAPHKWTLKTLREAGFDSVAGLRGITQSWGGTLNMSEWVVYSSSQVLVEKIFEYQPTKEIEDPYLKARSLSGPCCVAVNNPRKDDRKGMTAFQNLIVKKPCEKTGHTQIQFSNGYCWVCNECIERLRLKVGSRVEIVEKSWRSGCQPPKTIRITGVKQNV